VVAELKAIPKVTVPGSSRSQRPEPCQEGGELVFPARLVLQITISPLISLLMKILSRVPTNASRYTGACGSGGSAGNSTFSDIMIPVLAVPYLFDSGLSAVLDVLATANALREDLPLPYPRSTSR